MITDIMRVHNRTSTRQPVIVHFHLENLSGCDIVAKTLGEIMSFYTKAILETIGQVLKNRGQENPEVVQPTKGKIPSEGDVDPILEKIADIFVKNDNPIDDDDHDEVRDVEEEYSGREIDDWDEDDDDDREEKDAAKRAWRALKDAHKREWQSMKRRHEDERESLKAEQDSDRRELKDRFEYAYGGRAERRMDRKDKGGKSKKNKGRGRPWDDDDQHPGQGRGRGRGRGKGRGRG